MALSKPDISPDNIVIEYGYHDSFISILGSKIVKNRDAIGFFAAPVSSNQNITSMDEFLVF